MKLVPPIALFSAGFLMASSILVAMIFWINASYNKSQVILPQPPPKTFASTLEQATSLEGVKRTCASVAQIYDAQSNFIHSMSEQLSQLLSFILWGILSVGFIIGPIFLYIYFATRKHVSAHA